MIYGLWKTGATSPRWPRRSLVTNTDVSVLVPPMMGTKRMRTSAMIEGAAITGLGFRD